MDKGKLRVYNVVPALPARLEKLNKIASNLYFSWHPEANELFRRIDENIWVESRHNPVLVLGRVKQERVNELLEDDSFLAHMDRVFQELDRYMSERAPYNMYTEKPIDFRIAYFSMEFGLSDCLPVYSGGLGILSGDHLKSASDLNLPITGVGLLYQQGYFRQYLNSDGWQLETSEENDFHNLPVELLRDSEGKPLSCELNLWGSDVIIHLWKIQVGRISLYLMDTNTMRNRDGDRGITFQLYTGDRSLRLKQEIVLGIGGMRFLKKLQIEPEVVHLNEGHSAFAVIERIRHLMVERKLSFSAAREIAMGSTVFTTHTPVPAGNETFDPKLLESHFASYIPELGISMGEFLGLGRANLKDPQEPFNMTILALRLSSKRNGVSGIHGQVARRMWKDIWPSLSETDVPIGAITNGVHIPSWISYDMRELYDRYLGPRWIEDPDNKKVWERVDNIPDSELWRTHERRRERLIAYLRRRLREQLTHRGAIKSDVALAEEVLNPEALTLGFARRFATYKRGTLILKDKERLAKILSDPKRPVQIIFAGKAHPMDTAGKEMIKDIVHTAERPEFRHRIVFLEDYDMNVAHYMVQGVDIWLNNPVRPLEACGTSGMKSTANGALNLSVLDGWWPEGYSSELGWAIGHGEEYQDREAQDDIESRAIYTLLEREIVPLFYERGYDGMPRGWIRRMKLSIRTLCPMFNTHRMLQDYMEQCYYQAADYWKKLLEGGTEAASTLATWKDGLSGRWGGIKILDVKAERITNLTVGSSLQVEARVAMGSFKCEELRVEIYYGLIDSMGEFVERDTLPMDCKSSNPKGETLFVGSIPCLSTGRFGFMIRIRPQHPYLADINSTGLILWG